MPRVKEARKCKLCKKIFYRHNGNVNAKYCSVLCSCRTLHTKEHQVKAGKASGLITIKKLRGTGTKGYIKFYSRHHHRVIMEKKLGRKLRKGEIVHHKDENKHNNSPDNLEVMTQSQHIKLHLKVMLLKQGKKYEV